MSEENNKNGSNQPMDDKQRQRTMDFILEHQAKFNIDLENLTANVSELTNDVQQIGRVLKMGLVAGRKVRSDLRKAESLLTQVVESQHEQSEKINILIDHQMQTNEEISSQRARTNEELSEIRVIVKDIAKLMKAHIEDSNAHKHSE